MLSTWNYHIVNQLYSHTKSFKNELQKGWPGEMVMVGLKAKSLEGARRSQAGGMTVAKAETTMLSWWNSKKASAVGWGKVRGLRWEGPGGCRTCQGRHGVWISFHWGVGGGFESEEWHDLVYNFGNDRFVFWMESRLQETGVEVRRPVMGSSDAAWGTRGCKEDDGQIRGGFCSSLATS